MRVLVLTSSYPTPDRRIASAFLDDWVNALGARGHELTVLAPCARHRSAHTDRTGRKVVSYFQYLPWPRCQTLAYGAGMYDNVSRNPLRLVQLPSFLRALYERARDLGRHADLLHAHWLFPAGLVGALVKRELGLPLVISIHSTDFHLLRSMPGGRTLARAIVRWADRLHFVTSYHHRRFDEWIGRDVTSEPKAFVTPMGVPDTLADRPSRPFHAIPKIGFMGRLIHLKGVDRLLEACAELGRPHLTVAGEGPALGPLKQLAEDLQVNARFVGVVSGAAKAAFLDSCDIIVFPSRHYSSGRSEGLPVSLLEALARGRVVVASDSGGIPEVIRHGQNGYLFSSHRLRALEGVLGDVIASWPAATCVGANAAAFGRRMTASALAPHHEAAYGSLFPVPDSREEPA